MRSTSAPVFTTVVAVLATPALGSRLSASVDGTAGISLTAAERQPLDPLSEYEDITEVWRLYDEGSSIDVKCCCEASGRCGIFRTDGSCRWVGDEDRIGVGPGQGFVSRLRSYSTRSPPACLIDHDSVEEVTRFLVRSQRASSRSHYCPAYDIYFGEEQRHAGHVNSAFYHQTIPFQCGPGFSEEVTEVRCDYHNITQGRFSPEPVCNALPEFCHPFEHEFGMNLTSASNQEEREVLCMAGYKVPEGKEITRCLPVSNGGEGGAFDPEPECIRDEVFCNVVSYEDGGANATGGLYDVVPVLCPPGWEPETPSVQCTDSGAFSPPPLCMRIEGFCAAISADGVTVEAARLHETPRVTCDAGRVGTVREVECRLTPEGTGAFFPEARCGQHCLQQQTLLAGFVGDACQGPSVNPGACFTRPGDPNPWHCWPAQESHAEWTDQDCTDMGYAGACYFDEALEPASADDVGDCRSVSSYTGHCDDSWGACYVSHRIPFSSATNDGRWACIESRGGRSFVSGNPLTSFSLGDCKVQPIPFELARRIGRATYDSVCKI